MSVGCRETCTDSGLPRPIIQRRIASAKRMSCQLLFVSSFVRRLRIEDLRRIFILIKFRLTCLKGLISHSLRLFIKSFSENLFHISRRVVEIFFISDLCFGD